MFVSDERNGKSGDCREHKQHGEGERGYSEIAALLIHR